MVLDNWMVYTAAEILLVLLILCGLLLFHAKGLKAAIQALQGRLAQALSDLKAAKQAAVQETSNNFESEIDQQIAKTAEFHAKQNPDRSIEEDLSADSPPARLVAAMRHRFLKAEKASQSSGEQNWDQLAQHYKPLVNIQTEQPPSSDDDPTPDPGALSYEEQRHEIARFKRLFTTMEGQWKDAKQKAEGYYQELIRLIGNSDDPEHQALKVQAQNELKQLSEKTAPTRPEPGSPMTGEELDHLKAENAVQRAEIEQLKARLANAGEGNNPELIADLEQQLEKQLRLMRESEVCIELLEQEIAQLNQKFSAGQNTHSPANIEKFIKEKQQLSGKIKQLEGENEQLVGLAEHADAEQRRKLAEKDAEIHKLKKKLVQLLKGSKAD